MKTVVGLFDDYSQASNAVSALEGMGLTSNDISLVANNSTGQYDQYARTAPAADDTTGAVAADATTGAAIGGAVGLLMGLGLFVIPGFGPIAAAGWLTSTLTGAGIGAVTGGLVGLLANAGVPHEEAAYYNEGVRRGGTIVAVRASDDQAHSIAQTLGQYGAVNIEERAAQYRNEGFTPPAATV